MNETIILPEMLEAGMEALAEAQAKKFAVYDTVIAVYLAMRAIEQIAVMRQRNEILH